jgi:hypothetical protein
MIGIIAVVVIVVVAVGLAIHYKVKLTAIKADVEKMESSLSVEAKKLAAVIKAKI